MARKRIIDPDFFLDEKMAKLDYKTRLLYIGLWTLADDYGILENDIEKIRVQIFPYSYTSIQKNIQKLIDLKRITPFEVEGKRYFFIENYLKYQWFSHPSSKYPQIPEITGKIQKLLANRTRTKLNLTEHNLTKHNKQSLNQFYKESKEILKEKMKFNGK